MGHYGFDLHITRPIPARDLHAYVSRQVDELDTWSFEQLSYTPVTYNQGQRLIAEHTTDDMSVDDGFCVPVYADKDVTTRTITITFTATAATDFTEYGHTKQSALFAAARTQVKLAAGEFVDDVRQTRKAAKKSRTETRAMPGATVTRFYVTTNDTVNLKGPHHSTQAEARKAATAAAETAKAYGKTETFDVIGVSVRESGDPLVRATSTIETFTITADVTVAKVAPGAVQGGWVVSGWHND